MDIHDLRRAMVARLIETRFGKNNAAFCAVTGIAPSYVTRMLKSQTDLTHKKIGETMALRLEAIPELGLAAGELLDPKPLDRSGKGMTTLAVEQFTEGDEPSSSEWGHLQEYRQMSKDDRREIDALTITRSEKMRALRREVMADLGLPVEAPSGSGDGPPRSPRVVAIQANAKKDSARKSGPREKTGAHFNLTDEKRAPRPTEKKAKR